MNRTERRIPSRWALFLALALAGFTLGWPDPAFGAASNLEPLAARAAPVFLRHLDLLTEKFPVPNLKGKSAEGMTMAALEVAGRLTGQPRYHKAARGLADLALAEMRGTRFGVPYIKEKTKGEESIPGGGPPAWGINLAEMAAIYAADGATNELAYLGSNLDHYPWNTQGWWAATIDVTTGQPKEGLDKPSPINKNASLAYASYRLGTLVRYVDPATSVSLLDKCASNVIVQILPAQTGDGFWHYGLTGGDPKGKDVLGYFMLTVELLTRMGRDGAIRDFPGLSDALARAVAFTAREIAPMTDPFPGTVRTPYATEETPRHYRITGEGENLKRGSALAMILGTGGFPNEGGSILKAVLDHFPAGDRGMDGAHGIYPLSALYPPPNLKSFVGDRRGAPGNTLR